MSSQCGHEHISLRNLGWAIFINVTLTIVQLIAGVFSGSLSLIADAIHNLSDAASLVVAYIAEKVSHWPEDKTMTYGYGRAQIIGAFINSLTLIFVALYISYEVVLRFLDPQPIDGWIVVYVASFALVIDLATAKLTHQGSKHNINMRAAFIHNVSDAMASVVVIISGILVILYDFYIFDLLASLLISAYILFQSFGLIKDCLKHLMQGIPEDLNYNDLEKFMKESEGVKGVETLCIWSINDKKRSLQARISFVSDDMAEITMFIAKLKLNLAKEFKIQSSFIEIHHS